MRDPYEVLGVSRGADQQEIKSAYRRLARTLHPDLNPDDPKAEDKFKEASTAYDLLSDEIKRGRYDRGEVDANGQEKRRAQGGGRSGGHGGFTGGFGFGGRTQGSGKRFSFEDIFGDDENFADVFARSQGPGGRQHSAPQRGGDTRYRLSVTFEEAALGATRTVTLATGKKVSVKVPPATEDGRTLRLKGMGRPGLRGGADGDALVEIKVKEHAVFSRGDGLTVVADIPVSLVEAVDGGKIRVPTIDGAVQVTVPEASNTGTVLRLRGKGLPGDDGTRGDQLCRLKIVLEDPADPKLKALVKKLQDTGVSLRARLGLD
jgi:DnaJ-class molecular chaperone